jgi:antitoxin CptB
MAENPEIRRKRLLFRSRHRGTKEMDLLIGSFAERYLDNFDGRQMDCFEALLEIPEPVIYSWLVGRAEPSDEQRDDVVDLLLAFDYPRRSHRHSE